MADTQHSKKFYILKNNYDRGLMDEFIIRLNVKTHNITPEEYEEIVGQPYPGF